MRTNPTRVPIIAPMAASLTTVVTRLSNYIRPGRRILFLQAASLFVFQYSEEFSGKKGNVYNILWVLVFGFATLNILGLIARRFEPRRSSNLNFGEILAITVVVVSIILLSWEMLYLFHVLPIKLEPR